MNGDSSPTVTDAINTSCPGSPDSADLPGQGRNEHPKRSRHYREVREPCEASQHQLPTVPLFIGRRDLAPYNAIITPFCHILHFVADRDAKGQRLCHR